MKLRTRILSFMLATAIIFTSFDVNVYATELTEDVNEESIGADAPADDNTEEATEDLSEESSEDNVSEDNTSDGNASEDNTSNDNGNPDDEVFDELEEIEVQDEETLLKGTEEASEELIVRFDVAETINMEFKPALDSLKEELPKSVVAITNKDNEIEISVDDWISIDDYDENLGKYRFRALYDYDDIQLDEGVKAPILTVVITNEGIGSLGYIDDEDELEVPVVNRNGDGILRAADLPSSYSNKNNMPTVRNQDIYGTCWAHTNVGAVEADLIKNDPNVTKSVDLSELQLAYFTSHTYDDPKDCHDGITRVEKGSPTYLDAGGNDMIARNAFLNMVGLVKESDVPYSGGASLVPNAKNAVSNNYAQVLNYYTINRSDIVSIKKAVMEHGAVTTSIFAPNDSINYYWYGNDAPSETAYFNYSNNCLYGTKTTVNHGVLIVGWDDNFSKEKFDSRLRPNNDGAWLVRNSWGYNGFGYKGYFWVSYENATFKDGICTAYSASTTNKYDYVYSYDTGEGYYDSSSTNSNAKGQPITFSVDYDVFANESIEAAVVKTINTNGTIKVEVTDGYTTAYGQTTFETAGAYNIKLDSPIEIREKTNVELKVTIIPPANQVAYIVRESGDKIERGYTVNGEKIKWCDAGVKLFTNKLSGGQTANRINVKNSRIIDYANTTHQIELESNSVTANAADFSWKSDNTEIATVDENGLITIGCKKGTTTIRGTYKHGSSTYNAQIEVKVKPYTISYYQYDWSDSYSHNTPHEYYPGDPDNCKLLTSDEIGRIGYRLEGWYLDYDWTNYSNPITSENLINKTGDITLYPKWEPLNIAIYYYIPKADLSGYTSDTVKIYEGGYTYSIPNLAGEENDPSSYGLIWGKRFKEWALDEEGSATIGSSLSSEAYDLTYSNGKYTQKTEIYLYPIYEKIKKLNVIFNKNGGIGRSPAISVSYNSKYNEAGDFPENPTREGYDFENWHLGTVDGPVITGNTVVSSVYDHKLVANWIPKQYTVTLDANGGNCDTKEITVTYGEYYPSLPTPTRSGTYFVGWYNDVHGFDRVTDYKKVDIAKDHTIHAVWSFRKVQVDFFDERGKLIESGYYTEGEPFGEFFPYSKTGYKTTGWKQDGKIVSEEDIVTRPSSGSHIKLYWQGELKHYKTTVHFESCGAGEYEDRFYEWTIDEAPKYGTLPEPEKEGYRFEGWYLDEDYSMKNFVNERVSKFAPSDYDYVDENIEITLYAKWYDLGLPPKTAAPKAKIDGVELPASSSRIKGEIITVESATENAKIYYLRRYIEKDLSVDYVIENGELYTKPITIVDSGDIYYYFVAVAEDMSPSKVVKYEMNVHNHHYYQKTVKKASFRENGVFQYECYYCDKVADEGSAITYRGKEIVVNSEDCIIPKLDRVLVGIESRDSDGKNEFNEMTIMDYPISTDSMKIRVVDVDGNIINTGQYSEEVYFNRASGALEDFVAVTKNDEFAPGSYKAVVNMRYSSMYEGSEEISFIINTVSENVEPVVWSLTREDDTASIESKKLIKHVENGTKISLSTSTSGAQIFYTISDGENGASNLDDINGAIKYTEPIVLDSKNAVVDGDTLTVSIKAIAVKGNTISEVMELNAQMNAPDNDWGDVINGKDIHVNKSTEIPEGLWISDYTLNECIGDKGSNAPSLVYSGYGKQILNDQRIFYGKKLLKPNIDYVIKYTNNVKAWTRDGVKEGKYLGKNAPTIIVNGKGLYTGSFSKTFEIKPIDLSDLPSSRLIIKSNMAEYVAETKSAPKPKFTIQYVKHDLVKNKDVVVTLRENTDFKVDYSLVKSKPGSYSVAIVPMGNYGGVIEDRVITVVAPELLIQNAKLIVDAANVKPDGNDQTENVKVQVKVNDKLLTEGDDYTLTYKYTNLSEDIMPSSYKGKVISAGKYTVTVNGIGNFAGEKSTSFEVKGGIDISKANIVKLEGFEEKLPFGSNQNFILKNLATGVVLVEGSDYVVTYVNADKVGKATVTCYGIGSYAKSLKTSYTITGVKFSKDHVTMENTELEYAHKVLLAEETNVKVVNPDNTNELLVLGEDYYIEQPTKPQPYNVGTYKFNIIGLGKYAGSKVALSYKIVAKDISTEQKIAFSYKLNDTTLEYTGRGEAPIIYQMYDGEKTELTAAEVKNDFKVAYNSKKFLPGETVLVTVTGKGNYKGKTTMSYKIVQKDIANASFDYPDYTFVSNNNNQNPLRKAPTLTVKNGVTKLVSGKDYTLEYSYNGNTVVYKSVKKNEAITRYRKGRVVKTDFIVGDDGGTEILVKVTGKGNYSGTKEYVYRVMNPSQNIANAIVTIDPVTYAGKMVYLDGKDITVKASKVANAPELKFGQDYEITGYVNNNKAGKATVKLHGIGAYSGKKDVTFVINQKSMNYAVELRFDAIAVDEDGKTLTVTGKAPIISSPKSNEFALPTHAASKYVAKDVAYKLDKKGKQVVDTANTVTYKLEGWYDDQGNRVGGPGETWQATINGRTINPGETAVLTAKFIRPVSKTQVLNVTFNAGYEDEKPIADKYQSVSQANATKLSKNSFSRKGYTFVNWKDAVSENIYTDQQLMYYTGVGISELNLVAQWAPINYTIAYDLNGGSWGSGFTPIAFFNYDKSGKVVLPTGNDIVRTGYTFAGWKLGKTTVTEISKKDIGNKKIVAQWTPLNYTVKFDANIPEGQELKVGTVAPVDITKTVGKDVVVPANPQLESGDYVFIGWTTYSHAANAKYKMGTKVYFDTDTTLYGVWRRKQ